MTLNRQRLAINGTEGLMVVVYHPDAGSSDAEKLALLAPPPFPPQTSSTTQDTSC
jgi:hypothetical protein